MPSRLDAVDRRIAEVKGAIAQCNGEAYRGCWIDNAKDKLGKRIYYRLRWFKSYKPKKLGSRTLKLSEVGEARRAIALWAELTELEKQRDELQGKLDQLRAIASELGYELQVLKEESGYRLELS